MWHNILLYDESYKHTLTVFQTCMSQRNLQQGGGRDRAQIHGPGMYTHYQRRGSLPPIQFSISNLLWCDTPSEDMDVVITCSASAQSSVVTEAPAANVLNITTVTDSEGDEQQDQPPPTKRRRKYKYCSLCAKNNQIPSNKFGLHRQAKCCMSCAKENDTSWYEAFQNSLKKKKKRKKYNCTFCTKKTYISINTCGIGRCAKCCTACAKEYDTIWHEAYEKSRELCKNCKKVRIPNNKYGLEYKSEYCMKCAKNCDPPYYEAYIASTGGICLFCKKNRIQTSTYGLTRKALCCPSCAEVHDPIYYEAYAAAKGIYSAAQGICSFCTKNNMIPKAKYDLNRRADCCAACSKEHDPDFYAAMYRAERCKYNETSACENWRRSDLDGYCGRCFSFLYPNDQRARYLRYKERAVAKFVLEKFPEVPWRTDRQIPGGCSRRRPDIFVDLGAYALSVEVDEFEHAAYPCLCENKKMMEHFLDAKSKPHFFIRFNPDAFWNKGKKHAGCWSKNKKTKEPFVPQKKCKEWEERLNRLSEMINITLTQAPEREVDLIHLFYSDETWVNEEKYDEHNDENEEEQQL